MPAWTIIDRDDEDNMDDRNSADDGAQKVAARRRVAPAIAGQHAASFSSGPFASLPRQEPALSIPTEVLLRAGRPPRAALGNDSWIVENAPMPAHDGQAKTRGLPGKALYR